MSFGLLSFGLTSNSVKNVVPAYHCEVVSVTLENFVVNSQPRLGCRALGMNLGDINALKLRDKE